MAKKPDGQGKPAHLPVEIATNGDLVEEISRRVGSLVPQSQKAQVVAQVVSIVQQERFSGPIAHPKHLREYEDICPGAADRIITMAESNLKHNQEFQMQALNADVTDGKIGRSFGFFVFLMLMVGAAVSAVYQSNIVALAFLGTGALGVVGQFIDGRTKKQDDDI